MRTISLTLLVALAALATSRETHAADDVLAHVRAAHRLACGVLTEPEDYTKFDVHGPLDEFGPEICKAVAVAVLGPDATVTNVDMPDEAHGLAAAANGNIDLFPTASPDRPNAVGGMVTFGPTVLMDGQSFLVRGADGVHRFRDLAGKQVCFIANTRQETVLTETEAAQGIKVLPFPFEEVGEMEAALVTGHCAAMTADVTMLADARSRFHSLVARYVILPDRLTHDPVAPVTRANDPRWAAIVSAVMDTLEQAETAGVTQSDAIAAVARHDDAVGRSLPGRETVDGLAPGWQTTVIAAVGNAGELYRHTLGAGVNAKDLPREDMKPKS